MGVHVALCDFTADMRNFKFESGFENKPLYSKKKTISMAFFHYIDRGTSLEEYQNEFTSVSERKCLEISYKFSKRYNDSSSVDKFWMSRFPNQNELSTYLRSIGSKRDLRCIFG